MASLFDLQEEEEDPILTARAQQVAQEELEATKLSSAVHLDPDVYPAGADPDELLELKAHVTKKPADVVDSDEGEVPDREAVLKVPQPKLRFEDMAKVHSRLFGGFDTRLSPLPFHCAPSYPPTNHNHVTHQRTTSLDVTQYHPPTHFHRHV